MISGTNIPFSAALPITDPRSALVVLQRARELIARRGSTESTPGWAGPRAHARNWRGDPVGVASASAVSFGIGAALVRAWTENGLQEWAAIEAQRAFARANAMMPVEFNKTCRNQADAVHGIDRAIRLVSTLTGESYGEPAQQKASA